MDLVFSVRCKKGSMEHEVDLPHFEETELISDEGENFDDGEGSFSF